ncbi:putative duf167 domain protein [Erysiphe necator]|uniref:Putative duf167 domain protein n=1 Tax=Uncinula necator TaxID=52586 RepID=A0A0B1P376_UNCNE|nr:putative duf167 domain protein [Erysiphe necator]
MVTSPKALRYVATSNKRGFVGCIYLNCYIKTGVSAARHGILSVMTSHVSIGVSAKPRHNQANKAVGEIISQSLSWPRSDVEIIKGHKSQLKTVAIKGVVINGEEDEYLAKIRSKLEQNSIL